MSSVTGRRIIHAFVKYLEEEQVTLADYGELISEMGFSLLNQNSEKDTVVWGVSKELSKLIIALYDETSDAQSERSRQLSNRCLDIWDLMYKNQIGEARALTNKMMEI